MNYLLTRIGLKSIEIEQSFEERDPESEMKIGIAFRNLMEHADEFRVMNIKGLKLGIGDHYSLSAAGVLYISWDFKVFLEKFLCR